MARQRDPLINSKFLVNIDGFNKLFGFNEVTGLESEVTEVKYREGNDRLVDRKLRGRVTYPDIVLKRGVYAGVPESGVNDMLAWYNQVHNIGLGVNQTLDTQNASTNSEADDTFRRVVRISILQYNHATSKIITLRYAWPKMYKLGDLSAEDEGAVLFEELTLCHEGMDIVHLTT